MLLSIVVNLIMVMISFHFYNKFKSYKKGFDNIQQLKSRMTNIYEKTAMSDDKNEICKIILKEVIEFVKFSTHGSLILINEDGKFEYAALQGYSEELKNISFEKEELYLYRINNFKEPAIIKDLHKLDKNILCDMKYDKLNQLGGLNIKSTISFPIHVNGEVIAIMNLDSEDYMFDNSRESQILYNQIKCDLNSIFENYNVREKLTKLANVDDLTGLINKRKFKNIFKSELKNIQSKFSDLDSDEKFIVVFIDIDDFKVINDEKGHYFGDAALMYFANLLTHTFPKDIVSRIYGDEFAILCRNTEKEEVEKKLLTMSEKLVDKKLKSPIYSVSYGVVKVDRNNCFKEYSEIMKEVDKLMYKEKRVKKKSNKKLFLIN